MTTHTQSTSDRAENYDEPIGIRLHRSTLNDLETIKRKKHLSRNALIRMAIDALVEHEKLTGQILTVEEMRRMLQQWSGAGRP